MLPYQVLKYHPLYGRHAVTRRSLQSVIPRMHTVTCCRSLIHTCGISREWGGDRLVGSEGWILLAWSDSALQMGVAWLGGTESAPEMRCFFGAVRGRKARRGS